MVAIKFVMFCLLFHSLLPIVYIYMLLYIAYLVGSGITVHFLATVYVTCRHVHLHVLTVYHCEVVSVSFPNLSTLSY